MKNSIITLIIFLMPTLGLLSQTAEENVSKNYIQHEHPNDKVSTKGDNWYLFEGKKYTSTSSTASWSDNGKIAVMNSAHGSFQVYFKSKPSISKKYTVKDHLKFYSGGTEGEVGVVLLLFDEGSIQYWSVNPTKGTVKVKVIGNKISIEVKNINICIHETTTCSMVSGRMTLNE